MRRVSRTDGITFRSRGVPVTPGAALAGVEWTSSQSAGPSNRHAGSHTHNAPVAPPPRARRHGARARLRATRPATPLPPRRPRPRRRRCQQPPRHLLPSWSPALRPAASMAGTPQRVGNLPTTSDGLRTAPRSCSTFQLARVGPRRSVCTGLTLMVIGCGRLWTPSRTRPFRMSLGCTLAP